MFSVGLGLLETAVHNSMPLWERIWNPKFPGRLGARGRSLVFFLSALSPHRRIIFQSNKQGLGAPLSEPRFGSGSTAVVPVAFPLENASTLTNVFLNQSFCYTSPPAAATSLVHVVYTPR